MVMNYKFDNPIRLIELFAGYGSQALALKYLDIPFEHHFICEFDKYAIQSYNDIHGTNFDVLDIRNIHAEDLNITEVDKYKYLMTYSFPCTDLSLAGKRRGMQRESGTSSSLLWEVERLLKECKELPQYLLMENVPQVISNDNIKLFGEWIQFLIKLGYVNYYKLLNAKDFGVPQNRERCFMVSILKSENKQFSFPKSKPLEIRLNDLLETDIDFTSYILSNKNKESIVMSKFYSRALSFLDISHKDVCSCLLANEGALSDVKIIKLCNLPNSSGSDDIAKIYQDDYRALTPKEYFRLMGVQNEDYNKLTVSTTQRYKQAGNSIVVDVLMAIFENMFLKNCKSGKLF